ncbi:hypothetical protein [Streptomyces sp. NBC_01614]|uniref:Uncharacterized protein n=1 Tax=Streptomyces sp. NBC_00180 TaxID=2903632 RepID=A0AAU1I1W4_9ACTN
MTHPMGASSLHSGPHLVGARPDESGSGTVAGRLTSKGGRPRMGGHEEQKLTFVMRLIRLLPE